MTILYEISLDKMVESNQNFDTPRIQGFDSANNLLFINKEHLLATV